MAKGLKIAHIQSDGTKADQAITSIRTQGSVGGIPQWITGTGGKTIKVEYRDAGGILHGNAYIITQKGATKFLVANAVGAVEGATHSNANVTVCTLAAGADAPNGTPPATASTCSIVGYTTANAAFYASRITNKYVYDQSNNKYLYRDSDSVATADFANVIAH
jgi:ABC-type branched-subunit amino acid transport system substrate-binding protein